ncbi:hypothetical protein FQR65_LT11015 [Abscondita terminalis]|nr:hypothetical protein FQR65_LT11015 [Abscondita terminalis]
MHGWYAGHCKRTLIQATLFGLAGGATFYLSYIVPKMKRQREFYENYDAEKIFQEMRMKGLFNSCRAKKKH